MSDVEKHVHAFVSFRFQVLKQNIFLELVFLWICFHKQ